MKDFLKDILTGTWEALQMTAVVGSAICIFFGLAMGAIVGLILLLP